MKIGRLFTASTTLTALTFAASALLAATPAQAREFVFSVSWQPAFCERMTAKKECQTQTADRFDASSFTLHGLWPQEGQWCDVSRKVKKNDSTKQWDKLPAVRLSSETRTQLEQKMPGTASYLDRHEWIRHGTCAGTSQEEYFKSALSLLDNINASELRKLVASRVGGSVELKQLTDAVEKEYGTLPPNSIAFLCERNPQGQMLTEIRFYLETPNELPQKVSGKLLTKPQRPTPGAQLCNGGKVAIDAAGK